MSRTHVKLEGGRELANQLRTLDDRTRPAVLAALGEVAVSVRNDARAAAPVDTGRLRGAIEARVQPSRLTAEVGVWDPEAYYSQWVELGNSRQAAQPFLNPAFQRARRSLEPALRRALLRRLR